MIPEIKTLFIPPGSPNRPGRALVGPKYLTFHDTGNPRKGANALAHARLVRTKWAFDRQVSWHFTVDDQEIYQSLPLNEEGYHAGDGGLGPGNLSSIGIEICENADGDRARAEANAAALGVYLLKKFSLGIEAVKQHSFWNGKDCPRVLRARLGGWTHFVNTIKQMLEPPWDPAAEIQQLRDAGLINRPHEPKESVEWGELATVLNRLRK